MNWFWMNVPLMVVFFAAWAGIPLWLVLKHPDTGPVTSVSNSRAFAAEAAPVQSDAALEVEAELVGQR